MKLELSSPPTVDMAPGRWHAVVPSGLVLGIFFHPTHASDFAKELDRQKMLRGFVNEAERALCGATVTTVIIP